MITEKVKWVRFPARINTVYGKLSPINDLFLKILNETDTCHRFSCRILDPEMFSAMLHQNIVRQNEFFKFPPTFCILYADLPMQIGNCQLANQNFANNAFEAAEFWCIVGLTAV